MTDELRHNGEINRALGYLLGCIEGLAMIDSEEWDEHRERLNRRIPDMQAMVEQASNQVTALTLRAMKQSGEV